MYKCILIKYNKMYFSHIDIYYKTQIIDKTFQVRWVRVYHRSLLHHFLQHFKTVHTIFWK